ncbi:MAG: bifunctional pyr operon transcriptional regulator/uracil phosphoribosyltransferase PyrR [Puniceicoccales bacterium]
METHSRIGPAEIEAALQRVAAHLVEIEPSPDQLIVAGIANGGVPFGVMLTRVLSAKYGVEIPFGQLNITFQRDDLGHNPLPGEKERTYLPVPVKDKTVILADDVMFSGRSVRAALAELFDLGRPECVRLAILFDRGGRRLPVQPDVSGIFQPVDPSERVQVELHPDNPDANAITISPK